MSTRNIQPKQALTNEKTTNWPRGGGRHLSGTRMTVLRNRFKANVGPCASESDYLKGTVLQVKAINLPYVLVDAFDPMRGRANVSVDVRDRFFSKVDDGYADAVIRGCYEANEEHDPFE